MDPIIKKKILDLAQKHQGRKNAIDVRLAADQVGVKSESVFRGYVRELFESGHLVICLPRLPGKHIKDYHGFCIPSIADLKFYIDYHYKHTLSRLHKIKIVNDRVRKLENKKEQLELIFSENQFTTDNLDSKIKDCKRILNG